MWHPELILDARSGPADWPSLRGWQRLLVTSLIVCLPVPTLAASGLAVPLPSIVYRVAVGLAERTQAIAVGLPGFEAVVAETTETPRPGTIRLSAQELAGDRAATVVPAREHVDDGVRVTHEPGRPLVRAVVKEASPTRPRPGPARADSAAGRAPTQGRQGPTPSAALGKDIPSAPAMPSAEQAVEHQENAPAPVTTPTAEAEQGRPSPRPSDEAGVTPSTSPRPPDEPNSATPKRAPTSEPAPAVSDTPKPRSAPASPADEVATPDPGSPRETPRVQVEAPNTGPIAVTPVQVETPKPGSLPVTPSVPVDAPNADSLPVTPPEKSNGSVGAPQLLGQPELPSVPRLPELPGRPK